MQQKMKMEVFPFKPKRLAQAVSLLLLGLSSSVIAAEVDNTHSPKISSISSTEKMADHDVIQLADVVVTTRRREEKAQDVPTAISILSAKTLETQRLTRVEELQQALPSLNVAFQNPRQSSVAVRGLGNNPASDGLEASVGVYLDNVYLGRPGMAVFDVLDVAQLELLRGPQGTLFGKNTTAGLLNISSKLPTFTPDHSAEISYGSRDYLQFKGTLSDALSETVAGRLSVYKTTQDGFIENLYDGKKLNDIDREGLRGQILWKPSEQFNLRWVADYHKEQNQQGTTVLYSKGPTFNHPTFGNGYNRYDDNAKIAGANLQDLPYTAKKINSDAKQFMEVEQGGTSLEANWTLDNGQKLTSISAYRSWDFTPTNSDATTADALRNVGVAVKDKQFSQELRWASAKSDTLDWVTGLYYFQQNLDNHTFNRYGAAADKFLYAHVAAFRNAIINNQTNLANNRASDVYGSADTKSYAAFGQGTWHITPQFDLTAGGRVTYEDKTARINRLAPTGGVDISTLPAAQQAFIAGQLGAYDSGQLENNGTSYSGLLTGSYKINPQMLAYATYSHGEKSGGFNLAVGSAPTAGADSLKIQPEKADNYELGLKQTLFNNTLQLNSNLFLIEASDYQTTSLQQVGASLVSVLQNAGQVRSQGAEIDATFQPVKGLTLNLNGSWNDAKYTEYKNAPSPVSISIPTGVVSQDLTGKRVYGVPEWIANFNFRYDAKKVNGWQPYVSGSYSWRDWSYGTLDNDEANVIKSYGLVNASVGTRYEVKDHQIDLSLWAKNLSNETYVTNVFNWLNGAGSATLGQPRTIGATLKFSY
ncbi:MAG: TonB-dependent receptor [Acinetobacter sp.]|uniref:TonB-dependent receptor n=1 Tax=Acinetobacter sp. TaxID=472 RepID=UPI0025844886|nr:TonB-dependent receptor [Acinetobacter sp.]MCE1270659.1 TonB-dependent receptor [Acinetobacter sp.]